MKPYKIFEQKNCCEVTTDGLFTKLDEKSDQVKLERFDIASDLKIL